MHESLVTPASLQPYLEGCGYTFGSRLVSNYRFDNEIVPLAGFYDKPFDARSACLMVTQSEGDVRAAASKCIPAGAPTVFVCQGASLHWWGLSADGPSESRTLQHSELPSFFSQHRDDLSPESIYSAKLRRPIPGRTRQLWFVDVGLMPATELEKGEDLHRRVENVIQDLGERLGGRIQTKKHYEDLYKTVFWLLAAKLLRDKGVEGFKTIQLTDIDEVFRRVGRHYADIDDLPPGGLGWRSAIDDAAEAISNWGYLGNISTESLAYLYEKALIDKRPKGKIRKTKAAQRDMRKELGIHSTPPVLIDHMLSQLWPLVMELYRPEDRRVFEPACGPASFLVAAMRWLRDSCGIPDSPLRHQYLRSHLFGLEVEPFAREVAKLSLTLSDVPYGNSWNIDRTDMFAGSRLEKGAANCTLFLANPPFEAFAPSQRELYRKAGAPITAVTKSTEMLKRTLPYLPPGGVFGIVLPQGVLHDRESEEVRRFVVSNCDLIEIDLFADKLFEEAEHEVTVLMGRRRVKSSKVFGVVVRRVRESGMRAFKRNLVFSSEEVVEQDRFKAAPNYNLFVRELDQVWNYLNGNPTLSSVASVGQGLSHKGKQAIPQNAWTVHDPPHKGDSLGYYNVPNDAVIYNSPPPVGINLDSRVVATYRHGKPSGKPQVLLNYGRTSREPWKLKAFIDKDGLAFSSRFIGIRPKRASECVLIWAILNSPVANAFVHSHTMKRDILAGIVQQLPLPSISDKNYERLQSAALTYIALAQQSEAFMEIEPREEQIKAALLTMDAEVLRLYDLPPRLERQLLDIFTGVERRGVGCTFNGFYPTGLSMFIPLHELISSDYEYWLAGPLRTRHKNVNAPELVDALRLATAEFAEEEE